MLLPMLLFQHQSVKSQVWFVSLRLSAVVWLSSLLIQLIQLSSVDTDGLRRLFACINLNPFTVELQCS